MAVKKVVVVDNEPDLLKILSKRLTDYGLKVYTADNGNKALTMIKRVLPDLILLDIMMPDPDGIEVKKKLSKDGLTAGIPVIFLTAKNTTKDRVAGFNLGVDDYIAKPFDITELIARINSVLNRRKLYEDISMTDALTGIYNMHFFKKQLVIFLNMATRYKQLFSLAIIDVDNLKTINDTYGHIAGDFVLKKLSSIMKNTLRKPDIITRYGGDEFAVILPETNKEQAHKVMKKLRDNIKNKTFSYGNNKDKISFSISIGLASCPDDSIKEAQLFELADANLYRDKQKNT